MKLKLLLILAAIAFVSPLPAADWLQWGGPSGDFHLKSVPLADQWPEGGPPLLWKRSLGDGYSSILASEGRLYTMYRDASEEAIICLDAASGKTLWEHRYARRLWSDHTEIRQSFTKGPNATPLIVGDRLIAVGTSGRMRSLDRVSGELKWEIDLPRKFGRKTRDEEYGYSASPIPYKDYMIVQVGGTEHGVIAIKPQDGSLVWKSAPTTISYAQPTILTLRGREQYVYFSTLGLHGLDPATGETLWYFEMPYNNGNHLTPVVPIDDEHLYVSSQFATGGGRLLKLVGEPGSFKMEQLWFKTDLRGSSWTLIRLGDHIYGSAGSHSVSILSAFDWKTGKFAWRERGIHMAQTLHADGKLIMLDEDGTISLARVTPEKLELLGSHQITESVSWSLPTLVDGKLYVRDRTQILALDLSPRN